jgi:Uri superfamily endonuclease
MEIPKEPGVYVLVGHLSQSIQLKIGALGETHLPAGVYCYCGSAKGPGGLQSRIGRHLRKDTRKFWHFDHLKENLDIIQVWWRAGKNWQECEVAQFLARRYGAQIPTTGFGSSDCRKGCASHLIYFKDMQAIDETYQDFCKSDLDFTRVRM